MSIDHLLGKVHNCDCMELMRQLPDKCVDLVLTDPPYGINSHKQNKTRGKVSGGLAISKDYGDCEWDKQIPTKEVFDEIFRISKYQIIWGGNYFSQYLPNSPCWLFWDKNNGETDFADGELAFTNFKSAVRKYVYTWNGMLQDNMKEKEERVHPTQKPTVLMRRILRDYFSMLDYPTLIVFDPFMGSGTTGLACEKEGRKMWFGCELELKYCAIAEERVKRERDQLKLF